MRGNKINSIRVSEHLIHVQFFFEKTIGLSRNARGDELRDAPFNSWCSTPQLQSASAGESADS